MKIRDRVKELRRIPANELQPNPKNWRTHPVAQQDALRGILAEIGFAGAELAYEMPDGSVRLIDGHARAEIAGSEEIPVLILDVTEAEADKILATFDPLGAMAGADPVKLDALLREVETGNQALADMLTQLAQEAGILRDLQDGEIVEDEIPEPPADPITKPGDIWILGNHRILCGDSTNAAEVDRLMAGQQADAVMTDPPYGVSYVGKTSKLTIENDDKAGLDRLIGESMDQAFRITKAGSPWYVAAPSGPEIFAFAKHLRRLAVWRQSLVWVKSSFVFGRSDYHYQHETFFYGWKPGAAHPFHAGRTNSSVFDDVKPRDLAKMKKPELIELVEAMLREKETEPTTVLREKKPSNNDVHPTMKPIRLIARLMRNSIAKDQLVYEPFLGSGTTLIAAEQLGMRCFGLELSPGYADVVVRRWEQLTNKAAQRITLTKAG